jgi:hypothetical protein
VRIEPPEPPGLAETLGVDAFGVNAQVVWRWDSSGLAFLYEDARRRLCNLRIDVRHRFRSATRRFAAIRRRVLLIDGPCAAYALLAGDILLLGAVECREVAGDGLAANLDHQLMSIHHPTDIDSVAQPGDDSGCV